jgi:hypothetical protein
VKRGDRLLPGMYEQYQPRSVYILKMRFVRLFRTAWHIGILPKLIVFGLIHHIARKPIEIFEQNPLSIDKALVVAC